jgi:hypothetical protein
MKLVLENGKSKEKFRTSSLLGEIWTEDQPKSNKMWRFYKLPSSVISDLICLKIMKSDDFNEYKS